MTHKVANALSLFALALCFGLSACTGMAPSGASHEPMTSADEKPTIASVGDVNNNTPMPNGNVAPIPDPTDDDWKCDDVANKAAMEMTPVCRQSSSGAVPYTFTGHLELDDGLSGDTPHFLRLLDRVPHINGTATEFDFQILDMHIAADLTFQGKIRTYGKKYLTMSIFSGDHPPFTPYDQEIDCPGHVCPIPASSSESHVCLSIKGADIDASELPECTEEQMQSAEETSNAIRFMPHPKVPTIHLPLH